MCSPDEQSDIRGHSASLRSLRRLTDVPTRASVAALATTAGSTHSRPSRYNALRHCLRQTRSVCAGSEATKQSSFVVRKLDCFAALAMTGPGHFRKSPVQPSCAKISCFLSDAKHFPNHAVSSHQGALAIVTDAGRDAMDAIVSTADERC